MSRILYKYLDIEGAKCMIGNQDLQFTNASQLNDPFDCHPRLVAPPKVKYTKLSELTPEEWRREKKAIDALNLRNDTWLSSFSKVNDSLLMWSHYCHNHTGVCIGLDIEKVKKSIPPMFGSMILDFLDVQYVDIIDGHRAYNNAKDHYYYQWRTKAKDWEYEQEVRLVVLKPYPAYAAFTPKQAKQTKEIWDWCEIRHYMPLKAECFESIYLGIRVEEKDREAIIQYVRKELNPQIKLYQMEVDENAFRLRQAII